MQESNEAIVKRIQAGETDLLPLLWGQVERYVKYQANRWVRAWRHILEFDDLYQCGYIAMARAAKTFDTAGDMAFIGWFTYYLRGEFSLAVGIRTKDPLNAALSLDAPAGGEGLTIGDTLADPEDPYEATETDLYRQQLRVLVRDALDKLPEDQGTVLRLRYLEGMTLKETGEVCGKAPETIRQRENKGLRRLRYMAGPLREAWNPYAGTGLKAWKRNGSSVQEMAVIRREELEGGDPRPGAG